MTMTMDSTADTVSTTKDEFLRAKAQLIRALEKTPDDRINWSPSETARTPVHIVAHAECAIEFIHQMMMGKPFDIATTADADRYFLDAERPYTTREDALSLLESKSDAFVTWLESVTAEDLAVMAPMPFGMGAVPVSLGITFPAMHTQGHTAQIDYIQTIYGDRIW